MKKDLLLFLLIGLLVAALILGTDIQTVDEYYLTHIDDITEDSQTVFLTIRCDTVLNNLDKLDPVLKDGDYIPKDGFILNRTEYVLRDGDTPFSILSRATRHEKIQMEYQGADKNLYKSVYVRGIGYLYEFSCGELSGWMYTVNGKFQNKGASEYILSDGDEIEFIYTCELGDDIGGNMGGKK